jgi:hypothetical protein
MELQAFLEAVDTALSGIGNPAAMDRLRMRAQQMADMTGWAPGVIDPEGRLDVVLARLQDRAKLLYAEGSAALVAELHDALGDLRAAIVRHDADVTGHGAEDDLDSL